MRSNIVIFDIDGTIAHNTEWSVISSKTVVDENYDWSEFHRTVPDCIPIVHNVTILKALAARKYEVWLITGRSEAIRPATVQWLNRQNIPHDRLEMRPLDDIRPDDVVKRERFIDLCSENDLHLGDFLCVFEDRNRVVDMWRDLGLPCQHVAPGDF